MDVALREIAAQLGGELIGDAERRIRRIEPIDRAGPQGIAFLANPRFATQIAGSQAGCLIVAPALREAAIARGATIVVDDPYLYYARLTQWWVARDRPADGGSVHPSAVVDPTARVDASAVIGALCFVGAGASIGAGTRLAPRVTIGAGCTIGARCLLHSGVVIGADGFGFAPNRGAWEKIEQLGAVRIGDDVEIGANTCIDRGALDDTVIEEGVKLDNLIQIGHNVRIGKHTAMAGCAAVAGSTTIGAHCTIAGAARIIGHLTLADHVHISVASVVTHSIRQPGTYSGIFPIDDNARWEKNAATLRQLHSLRERIRALEKAQSENKRQA